MLDDILMVGTFLWIFSLIPNFIGGIAIRITMHRPQIQDTASKMYSRICTPLEWNGVWTKQNSQIRIWTPLAWKRYEKENYCSQTRFLILNWTSFLGLNIFFLSGPPSAKLPTLHINPISVLQLLQIQRNPPCLIKKRWRTLISDLLGQHPSCHFNLKVGSIN